ncbi:hypothetical protein TRM7557_03107 [Tritonibacter multivorans]|uniref:Uncharacterized protein n=1 Tax=Tritonibacter multivorans TaxID=928856 RepID=A0A0P1GGT3_9RHOB|nr:hypothetical protein [Tritonibacter multivorans]MDA7422763.1 hypothetical protein [Tritonibacter multivorans]CUH80856.1 hypothetical protein TRM7557_03107 [Tritonibacter multivorans]SFD56668.1 hypothetical protein SAMN04488049_11655 [Tritonibacter multivorans]
MSDPFAGHQPGLSAPATRLLPITPDDATDLSVFVRGLCVTTSGMVQVTTVEDTTATVYVAAGAPLPVRIKRVWATGTDADGLVGLV